MKKPFLDANYDNSFSNVASVLLLFLSSIPPLWFSLSSSFLRYLPILSPIRSGERVANVCRASPELLRGLAYKYETD